MIDFHSHILPGIDDGSRSVEESLALLSLMQEQGVSTVIATPHFYADEQSVDAFLERRTIAYDRLMLQRTDAMPHIRLGAEVLYYNGISRLEGLERLCIEGTRVLLLELPFTRWSSTVVHEVLEIANTLDVTVVLAHIERYQSYQRLGVFDEFYRNGIWMQVNASYFADRATRRKALHQLRAGRIQLIGSDCHGLQNRPPRMQEATDAIVKRLGDAWVEELNRYAQDLLAP